MFFGARSDSVRSAGCLVSDWTVVADARDTCDRSDLDGTPRSAEDIHRVALANLRGEHARMRLMAEVLGQPRSADGFRPSSGAGVDRAQGRWRRGDVASWRGSGRFAAGAVLRFSQLDARKRPFNV